MTENVRKEHKCFKILGIQDDELVCLEEISNVCCCGEKSGQIHTITMRALTQNSVDSNRDPDNLRDEWVEAVKGGYTDDSLEDWVENAIYDAENYQGQYFPGDDTSYRQETNDAIAELSAPERKKIMDYFNKMCEDDYDTFVDFECSSCIHYESVQTANSFTYKTKFGKRILPLLDKFVDGELTYDELVEKL